MHKIIYVEVGGFKLPVYKVRKKLSKYWTDSNGNELTLKGWYGNTKYKLNGRINYE